MPLRSTMPSELSIQTPSGKTQLVKLEGEKYELGRAESNALCFQDVVGLSRKHLVFERDGTNWVVRDLGSTNGTFVNGARISGVQILRSKDRVNVGELSIVFNEPAAPAPPANRTVVFIEGSSTVVPSAAEATLEAVLDAEEK